MADLAMLALSLVAVVAVFVALRNEDDGSGEKNSDKGESGGARSSQRDSGVLGVSGRPQLR